MSFLEKMKSMVVETSDEPGDKKPVEPSLGAPIYIPPSTAPKSDIDYSAAKKRLTDGVNAKAPKAWVSLQEQISTLKEVIPDEASVYKAAIALLVKQGTPFEQIEQDAKSVIDILDGEKLFFDSEVEKQLAQKIGTRQKHLEDIKSQLKALEDQIASLNNQASEETTAIALDSNKINEGKQKFAGGYNSLKKDLTDVKNKISAYGAKNV